jgi:hypothetical protein
VLYIDTQLAIHRRSVTFLRHNYEPGLRSADFDNKGPVLSNSRFGGLFPIPSLWPLYEAGAKCHAFIPQLGYILDKTAMEYRPSINKSKKKKPYFATASRFFRFYPKFFIFSSIISSWPLFRQLKLPFKRHTFTTTGAQKSSVFPFF